MKIGIIDSSYLKILAAAVLAACVGIVGCGSDSSGGGGGDDDDEETSSAGATSGGGSFDAVAACEDWVASVKCGMNDVGMFVDCNAYKDTACDISEYFDCMTTNTKCDEANGVLDTSGWT